MNNSSGGFSFGSSGRSGDRDDDDSEVIDAIEVSGEPVSRTEAKSMGLASFDSTREVRSATSQIRREQLPANVSEELRNKLDKAWAHLKKNEIEEALTLAQEVVFESPTLVAAKLIIARCFINRKAYDKALAILNAIPEEEKTAEVLYYVGLCQSRLGRIKDAIDTLKLSRANSSDTLLRKRANDLLLHLQGEQTVCPICGKKTLYDSMVDVGNQTVCANCAKTAMEESEDEDEDGDDEELLGGTRKRKRLRPPLSRAEIAIRVLFCAFMLVIVALALYGFSILSPEYYGSFRSMFPESWTFLPRVTSVSRQPAPPPIQEPQVPRQQRSTISFDSPPLSHAVAGVEIRHKLVIDGAEDRDGLYSATFFPKPESEFAVDPKTGDFVWIPSEADAGTTFEITFSAVFRNLLVRDQISSVYVSPGPTFKNICSWSSPVLGETMHMVAEDLTGDGPAKLIVITGNYWQGEIAAFSETSDGFFTQMSRTSLPGRPSAAGVIIADKEKWLAVADYWNSRLRHYALRDGNLSEMAVDIDLPGRPLMAGFDRTSATSAILCRMERAVKVVSYRQENQLHSTKLGEWEIPNEYVWRRILVLPGKEDSNIGAIPLLIGGDPANSVLLLEKDNPNPRTIKLPIKGVILDAALSDEGRVYCLVDNDGALSLASFIPGRDGKASDFRQGDAGQGPVLGGLAAAKFSGNGGASDMVVLSSGKLGFAFMSATGGVGKATYWPLPTPSRLLGGLVTLPASEAGPTRVVYMDAEGEIWSVGMSTKGDK